MVGVWCEENDRIDNVMTISFYQEVYKNEFYWTLKLQI